MMIIINIADFLLLEYAISISIIMLMFFFNRNPQVCLRHSLSSPGISETFPPTSHDYASTSALSHHTSHNQFPMFFNPSTSSGSPQRPKSSSLNDINFDSQSKFPLIKDQATSTFVLLSPIYLFHRFFEILN